MAVSSSPSGLPELGQGPGTTGTGTRDPASLRNQQQELNTLKILEGRDSLTSSRTFVALKYDTGIGPQQGPKPMHWASGLWCASVCVCVCIMIFVCVRARACVHACLAGGAERVRAASM